MFDTLLLRPALHCNTALHFTTLHSTTLHTTYRRFTSSHLHFTTLLFSFTHLHFLSFYTSHHITSHHITSHHCPKKLLTISLHFTFYFIVFIYLFTHPINPTLHFTSLFLNTTYFPSLHFTFYRLHFPSLVYTFLTHVLKNMHFTLESPYRPFR
jgi:hypothetical protein